jgi:hypothetical protein
LLIVLILRATRGPGTGTTSPKHARHQPLVAVARADRSPTLVIAISCTKLTDKSQQ